ncbi:MAG TPA: nuclear transport factor 2 family protein [Woeseiaceae bacterium]|nr:nuclear transport factor 2 family protein [Woeseiaceae bacterium]
MSSAVPKQLMLQDLFATIDAMDATAFAGFLTDDAHFRFGSTPAVRGKAAIAEAVATFLSSIAALRHSVDFVTSQANVLVAEGSVNYTRHDGSQIALPFADVFTMDGSKISNYKIYMDIAPLYAE